MRIQNMVAKQRPESWIAIFEEAALLVAFLASIEAYPCTGIFSRDGARVKTAANRGYW